MKTLNKIKKENIKKISKDIDSKDKQVSIFSDLIVISYPFDNGFNFLYLCVEIALLLQPFLSQGLIARGVLTYGPLYHREDIIYGNSLIEAYETEKNIVSYPRILISDHLLQYIRKNKLESESIIQYLTSKDFDGFTYIDLFKVLDLHQNDCNVCKDNCIPYLEKVKKQIVKNLSKCKSSVSTIGKWRWLANKFNDYLKENKKKILPIIVE